MNERECDLLSVGSCYIDINFLKFPFGNKGLQSETETVGEKYEIVPGGSAVLFARICSAIGLRPIFIGKIGKDIPGELLKKLLEKEDIGTELIESGEVQTNIAPQYVNNRGETIMAIGGNANQSLTYEEVTKQLESYAGKVKYLYLGGYFKMESLLPYYRKIIEQAKAQGAKVVLDHGRVTNIVDPKIMHSLHQLIPQVEIYLPSENEFLQTWHFRNLESGLKTFHNRFPSTKIAVKRGKKGAVGIEDDNLVHIPAYSVDLVNTVGAGDAFNAGFIKAETEGYSYTDAIRLAVATAGITISQTNLPSLGEIMELYKCTDEV